MSSGSCSHAIGKVLSLLVMQSLLACSSPATMDAQLETQSRPLPSSVGIIASGRVVVDLACGKRSEAEVEEGVSPADRPTMTTDKSRLQIQGGDHVAFLKVMTSQALEEFRVLNGAVVRSPACAVAAEHLDLATSDSGVLLIAGFTTSVHAVATGASHIGALENIGLSASQGFAAASGSSTIGFSGVGSLDGRASFGGRITIAKGSIDHVDSEFGGSVAMVLPGGVR